MPVKSDLALYASQSETSRGRLFEEPTAPTRSPFQRDRDRVIHCSSFRKLKHKTQVFVYHEGDYYRTRLTHSIEVAQIARSLARSLRLDEDLTEALALAHDFGHTPFGHAGEDALNAVMTPYGGFDHNAQTIRILTRLEERYGAFDGLNLTWETLEGLAKHNGPLVAGPIDPGAPPASVPHGIAAYLSFQDLELHTYASAEAQVAAIADDIAYNNHDIDDGLRAGLFSLKALGEIDFIGRIVGEVEGVYPDIAANRLSHELVRRLINLMASDVLAEAGRRLAALDPRDVDAIRAHDRPVIAFSEAMVAQDQVLKAFLMERMYRHEKVNQMSERAKNVVTDLFKLYIDEPRSLPAEWAARAEGRDRAQSARLVADFIAGMTDRYALQEHARNFGSQP